MQEDRLDEKKISRMIHYFVIYEFFSLLAFIIKYLFYTLHVNNMYSMSTDVTSSFYCYSRMAASFMLFLWIFLKKILFLKN